MKSSALKEQALREKLEELFSKCFAILDKCSKYAN